MQKIIVTLGPKTNTLEKIYMLKDKGVDFVRINMSHSSLRDLKYYIDLSKKVDIPFIIDTEGSQVRTGDLSSDNIIYKENDNIRLYKKSIVGDKKQISLKPWQIIEQLQEGDILYVDFDTLVMRV
jgi:pyruvate kinase